MTAPPARPITRDMKAQHGIPLTLADMVERAQKLGRLAPPGASLNWHYLTASRPNGKGQTVRFCWTIGKNCAGYYLARREVYRRDGALLRRDQWTARRVKRKCADLSAERRRRHNEQHAAP